MKNLKTFTEFVNESLNEKEQTYTIMRFQNGRTKEQYGPGTVQQLARGFNLDSALEIHPEFGAMDMGRNIRGKKFKMEHIETIEELIKLLNFAAQLKERTPNPKNTYEIWESANEALDEALSPAATQAIKHIQRGMGWATVEYLRDSMEDMELDSDDAYEVAKSLAKSGDLFRDEDLPEEPESTEGAKPLSVKDVDSLYKKGFFA